MPPSTPSSAERAIAAALYAPIGLGAQLVDDVPAAVNRARQHIVFARFIGKMAVDQGVKELRHRLAPDTIETIETASTLDGDPDRALQEPNTTRAPDADELALPDYDQLAASHIVRKLTGLTPEELERIEVYESAHRHRRTVLGKIAQLQAT